MSAAQWAERLFDKAPMPDKRLNRRLVQMARTMAEKPTDSIPQAFGDWAATKGAYRLIENKRMTPEHLQRAFRQQTARDCQDQNTILVAQDSTSLSFPSAPATDGLGPITNNGAQGLHLHSALALRTDGLPIGLLHQHVWARPDREKTDRQKEEQARKGKPRRLKRNRPVEEKESFKWLRGMREARQTLAEEFTPETRPKIIWIGDRENDLHEAFAEIDYATESLVIRCNQNRAVLTTEGRKALAHDCIGRAPLLGKMDIVVPRNGKRAGRAARLEVRAMPVTLDPRSPHGPKRDPISLSLVEVRESAPPEGCEPLRWMLWTVEPAQTLAQAVRVVEFYARRWRIEDYHQVLKSGCRIEDVRFHTAERIALVVALYGPVAVRILQIRDLARLEPESPSTILLSETEWRVLYTQIHKRSPKPDVAPPSMRQAALWIGRLGGHLGRKGDGMPGITTLWRGWRDLSRLVEFHAALQG